MKISAINTYNQVHTVNKLATSPTENSTEITGLELPNYNQSVAFMGTRLIAFRKPVIIEENSKAVYQKVQRIFEKLPNGAKMSKPILFEVNGKKYGFTWDKSECDRLKLVIKDNIKAAEDWNITDETRGTMSCIFDKYGLLQVGELTQPLRPNYNQGAFFNRINKSQRRLRIDDMTFAPESKDGDIWKTIASLSTKNTSVEMNVKKLLEKAMLSDMFLEFTKCKTSILL